MDISALLKRFDLDTREIETFLKLLQLGAQPISVIARHVGVPRTTMYFVLDRLRNAKLVEEFDRLGIKYARCIPVDHLSDVIRNRERELDRTLSMIDEAMPELKALESTLSITPKIKFFEGKDEVMYMYSQIMREHDFCAFVDLASVKKGMPEYHDEIPKMIKEKEGTARELVVDSKTARSYKEDYESMRHSIKILPRGMRFESDIIICSDKVYMTAYGDRQVSAVEIFSSSLTQTQQVLFDKLWEDID